MSIVGLFRLDGKAALVTVAEAENLMGGDGQVLAWIQEARR